MPSFRKVRETVALSTWTWVCTAFTVLKIWLITAQPLFVIAPSPHDDEHFLFQAESLLHGWWLGYQGCLTLAKGAVYPLWLALNHCVGAPLLLSQALLYVFSCCILVRALYPVLPAPWARGTLYLGVLYNPASWDYASTTRITRDSIYPSLTLLLLALTIGAVLRVRDSSKASVPWAAAAGVTGALFVMTREEGIWVLPSLVLIVLWGAASSRRQEFRIWGVAVSCAAVAYLLPPAIVAYENWRHYSLFETCENTSGYFKSAYGALTRVKPDKWNPYVPVPRDVRKKIFAVSPAYRAIGLGLEDHIPAWTAFGCKAVNVCDDAAGGWFIWAFRDAVTSGNAGMPAARDWYRQVAKEINEACSNGQLDCLPARSSLAPPWRSEYLKPSLISFSHAYTYLTAFHEVMPAPPEPSTASDADLLRFADLANEAPARYRVRMTGLLRSSREVAALVTVGGRSATDSEARWNPAPPDAGPASAGLVSRRYIIETSHPGSELQFIAKDGTKWTLPINSDADEVSAGGLSWKPESYQREPMPTSGGKDPVFFRIRVLQLLTGAYSSLMPVLTALALVLTLLGMAQAAQRRSIKAVPLFAFALFGAVLTRLLLLSFIDVSSFPAINVLYLSPGYVLTIAAVTLVLIDAAGQVSERLKRKHQKQVKK